MDTNNRIISIDLMRGLTLLLMLFVNDIFIPGLPSWAGHNPFDPEGMGLAGWVLPGFLFVVGLAIPFSIGRRADDGEDFASIGKHIFKRTISLLIIGVLLINADRVNEELTGIGKNLYTILMLSGVFLYWNKYPRNEKNFFTVEGLKLTGIGILVFLVLKFRSGQIENSGSLVTGWWGIPGIIGWGYLVSAFVYLATRNNILKTCIAFLFFLSLNILSKLDLLSFLDPYKSFTGTITEGIVPSIILAGIVTSLVLKKYSPTDKNKTGLIIVISGISVLIAGFIVQKWINIPEDKTSPGWGLICIGISTILFATIYWLTDIREKTGWTNFIRSAGENTLTAYLVPYVLYSIIGMTGVPLLFYKHSGMPVIAVAGSLVWAFLITGLTLLVARNNIKLKL